MAWIAATAGLAVIVVTPLSSGEFEIGDGARLDAIGLPGIPGEIERQLQARRARAGPHRIEPRGQCR